MYNVTTERVPVPDSVTAEKFKNGRRRLPSLEAAHVTSTSSLGKESFYGVSINSELHYRVIICSIQLKNAIGIQLCTLRALFTRQLFFFLFTRQLLKKHSFTGFLYLSVFLLSHTFDFFSYSLMLD